MYDMYALSEYSNFHSMYLFTKDVLVSLDTIEVVDLEKIQWEKAKMRKALHS